MGPFIWNFLDLKCEIQTQYSSQTVSGPLSPTMETVETCLVFLLIFSLIDSLIHFISNLPVKTKTLNKTNRKSSVLTVKSRSGDD
jgi:hypothetical protein